MSAFWRRIPAPAIFMFEGVVQYIGAAFAVALFASISPLTSAWLRSVLAGIVLLLWRLPFRMTWRELGLSCLFGTALVAMNTTFYEAIARLDLGTTVSIEFIGPVIFAALAIRGISGKFAVALAFVGVVLIGGLGLDLHQLDDRIGFIWALVAGTMWVGYIVLGRRVAVLGRGLDCLAVGITFGSFLQLPFAFSEITRVFSSWYLTGLALAMALCSSVIPYILEQVILRDVDASLFALLSALLPVTSLLVGVVLLAQIPTPAEVAGLVCVSVAVALTYRRDSEHDGG